MATTEQRSGFKLPWASERSSEAASRATSSRQATPSNGDATTQVEAAQDSRSVAPDAAAASANAAPEAAAAPDAAPPPGPRDLPWPSSDAPQPASPDVPKNESSAEGEPSGRPQASASERHGTSGHANPLVVGLLKVMKDAAEAARQESLSSFAESAKARAEEIRADLSGANAEMRRISDEEIAEIRDWSKAQMVRIRQEADDRIAARRRRLEVETEEHAARIERRIERVQSAAGEYEAQVATFFESLLGEDDPAALAGFAALMPEPPDLMTEEINEDDNWAPSRTLDADAAAAAEAAALLDLDLGDLSDTDEADKTSEADQEPQPKAEAEAAEPAADVDVDVDASRQTLISVVGLISVASIAGFKRAIARTPGVTGVSLASGPGGEFEFTVRHAETVDLVKVVGQLDGFAATVINQNKGVLSVTASEPSDSN